MSTSDRARSLAARAVETVREDARTASQTEHVLLHSLRFVLEIPGAFGLVLRSLCYFAAGVVMESARLGESGEFDDSYDVTLRYSWLGPAFEHNRQTVWELRLAGVFCVFCGFFFYQTFAYFPLQPLTRRLLWVTCGVLVLEPAWVRIYVSAVGERLPDEREVWENGEWPF